MIVIIAQIRNFSLRRQVYLVEHKYTTHDIEIVKIENNSTNNKPYCYTIASFNEAGELCSCGSRLLENIETDNVQKIADIILQEAIDNNYGNPKDDMTVMVAKVTQKPKNKT